MGYCRIMKNKKKGITMNIKEIKNYKMNNAVYQLRRQVINLIYEAKNYGINLPRINVRVGSATKGNEKVLGVGGAKNIWITEKAINKSMDYLRHVVFHEIGHAVFNLPHNEKCPLMASSLSSPCTKTQALEILKGYAR